MRKELNRWTWVKQTDFHNVGWVSPNQLKAWIEQKIPSLNEREFSRWLPLDLICSVSYSCLMTFKREHGLCLGLPYHPTDLVLFLIHCFLLRFYTICLFTHKTSKAWSGIIWISYCGDPHLFWGSVNKGGGLSTVRIQRRFLHRPPGWDCCHY